MSSQRSRRRPAKAAPFEASLRRELGLAPVEQLELDSLLASKVVGAGAPIGGLTRVTSAPCPRCERWNYHLVDCPEAH